MAPENYWVYVLRHPTGKLDIGLTENVTRRLNDHNTGQSKWTKKLAPWELIWEQGPMPLTKARKLENLMKRQKGGDRLLRLLLR